MGRFSLHKSIARRHRLGTRVVWPAFSVDKLEKFITNKRLGVKTALKAMRG